SQRQEYRQVSPLVPAHRLRRRRTPDRNLEDAVVPLPVLGLDAGRRNNLDEVACAVGLQLNACRGAQFGYVEIDDPHFLDLELGRRMNRRMLDAGLPPDVEHVE